MVMPSTAKVFITSSTSPTISGLSAEVGSSNNMTFGSIASPRAIATRCCWPPDRRDGNSLNFQEQTQWVIYCSRRAKY